MMYENASTTAGTGGRRQSSAGRDEVGSAVEWLARMGYAAKGVVYVAVGALSASAAFLSGSADASGSRGAMRSLADEPLGTALLWAVAVGIVGYVVWRLVQAFADPEDRGTDGKALATRAVFVVSALSYGALGVWIVTGLLNGGGSGGSSSGSSAQSWSATLLSQPFGAWLLGLVAAAVAGYGIAEWVKAARGSFEKRLGWDLDGGTRDTVRRMARAGLVARGLVFLIIGGFLAVAAWQNDPSEAMGFEQAMETLGNQGWGPWVMGVVALGLVGYGLLQFVKARYRTIHAEP